MNNKSLKISKFVYPAAILYSIITGLSFLFGKMALENETIRTSGPIDMLAHRFSVSFIVIAVLVIFKVVKVDYTIDKIKKILPIALINPIAFFGFQAFGLQYATSSEAGILTASAPVFALILASIILKEKTTTLQKLSVLVSVIGVVYVTLMKSSSIGSSFDINNMKGIIFLVLSALSFAIYSIMARVLTRNFSSTELSFAMITISFLFFNIVSVSRNIMSGTLSTFFTPFTDSNFTISMIYLGVLSSLVTSLLTNFVLSHIEASKMSVFINLGTVISIVAGVVFLKEKIFYYHIIGSLLIVSGVLGTNFLDKKRLNKTLNKE